ncbi:hypothetical protein BROUX41_004210 [Berkeleyomyces rouxiae]
MSWASFATNSTPDLAGSGQRNSRRQKLAAMAGSMYRAGATAVDGIRETYAQSRGAWNYDATDIEPMPSVFPDCGIVTQGEDHLVIFPTYAKRHSKPRPPRRYITEADEPNADSTRDEEAWITEWEKNADENAICDVDVRGWLYTPQRPPLTKRMRLMVALARSMSGIPAARQDQTMSADEVAMTAATMAEIDRHSGGTLSSKSSGATGLEPTLTRRTTASTTASTASISADMTAEEIAIANNTLMTRISPFLTSPVYQAPVTVFFYDSNNSESRTFYTDDSGHFRARVALRFMPTNMRVLANSDMSSSALSKTLLVNMAEPRGISIISDVDDTVKYSNVTGGPREVLRNTFVHDLSTLTIDGVAEWYNAMAKLGVNFHYCSNSPWQVWPLLATFFRISKLPHGSMHLKQYNGMLQGMWESAADRKRPSLERLLLDFPLRQFLLIGDSGEADLELYTDLALMYPENIVGIFIRDITTPEAHKDAQKPGLPRVPAGGPEDAQRLALSRVPTETSSRKQILPPPMPLSGTAPVASTYSSTTPPPLPPVLPRRSPRTEKLLIDFSATPPPPPSRSLATQLSLVDLSDLPTPPPSVTKIASPDKGEKKAKPKPPRPSKPAALRGPTTTTPTSLPNSTLPVASSSIGPPIHPPLSRKPSGLLETRVPPKTLTSHPSLPTLKNSTTVDSQSRTPPPLPPPRRRITHTASGQPLVSATNTHDKSQPDHHSQHHPHLTPALAPVAAMTSAAAAATPPAQTPAAVQRRIDLWQTRLNDAQWKLDRIGIPLYTWRKGRDVMEEALGIIQAQQKRP